MIICCGESLIDMIPIEIKDNDILYSPLTGGAIFNTSIALGRLNISVGYFLVCPLTFLVRSW